MFSCFKKRDSKGQSKVTPEFIEFEIENFNPLHIKNGKISDTYVINVNHSNYICKRYNKEYEHQYRNEIAFLKNVSSSTFFPFFFKNLVNINYRFILYEYIDGCDLLTFSKKELYPITSDQDIKDITCQITDAFIFLLERNLIYLNLRPSNIIISYFKPIRIKLIDVKYSHYFTDKSTKPYRNYGYCSPEIVFQKLSFHNSDVWSIGCLIYFILYNRHLFSNNSRIYFNQLISFKSFSNFHVEKTDISTFTENLIEKCLTPFHFKRPSIYDIQLLLKN